MSSQKSKVLPPQPNEAKASWAWLFYVIAAVLVAIPFGLGKYFELNSPGVYDAGAYVYSAKRILDGAQIGVDEKPSAQVGTLMVNMMGVKFFGYHDNSPKIMQGIFQAAALILMFLALHALWGRWAAVISTWLTAFYLSAPTIAKFGNVKEQFMIAFMVMGMSCYLLGQVRDKKIWTLLAGFFVVLGPLFKQTGVSAFGAMGLFVLIQPLLKGRTWKETGRDILWLLAGAALSLVPICLWLASLDAPLRYYPYSSIIRFIIPMGSEGAGGYVADAHKLVQTGDLAARVGRYYATLILPITLAVVAGVLGLIHLIQQRKTLPMGSVQATSRFVVLLGIWWILDMSLAWISPRSYEQYFLPLNASALMLGAYGLGWYTQGLRQSPVKIRWIVPGLVAVMIAVFMATPIVAGTKTSPHSGTSYGERRRGYVQKWHDIQNRRKIIHLASQMPDPKNRHAGKQAWEIIGDMIREQSDPNDRIYVWGWMPGIYVRAQRMSAARKAFESNMHTVPPEELSRRVSDLLEDFEKHPPKYIVDTRKNHFPWIRPSLELWPRTQNGFIPEKANAQIMDQFDQSYLRYLQQYMAQMEQAGRGAADPKELERYKAMRPLRDYLVQNYRVVQDFGSHVLFERK